MITLSSTLTATQQSSSYVPYTRIYLPDYQSGTDLSDYVKEVLHTEQTYGGGASILLGDLSSWYFISSNPIALKGQQVNIGYGFVTTAGKEYKDRGPVWVRNARRVSLPGTLAVQLECFDIWEKLGMIRAAGDDLSTAKSWVADTTIYDIIDELLTAASITLTKDSSDGIVDVFMPNYQAGINDSMRDIIIPLMGLTNCYIRSRSDGMHIGKLAEDTSSDDYYAYELGGDHTFFSSLEDDEVAVPNRIIVLNDYDDWTYKGEAIDTNSYASLGYYVPRLYAVAGLSSDAQAQQFAEAILCAIQRSVSHGIVVVPHNCGQELFDYVVVTDTRWP